MWREEEKERGTINIYINKKTNIMISAVLRIIGRCDLVAILDQVISGDT